MKLTVASLTDKQCSILQKTNNTEITLTVQYMDFLVETVKTHGVAEMIGRESKSLFGGVVDVAFKKKVQMGYPNTAPARERVRCLMQPVWKHAIVPCISFDGDVIEYDSEKLVQFHADVKSGKLNVHKAGKGPKKPPKGTMSKGEAYLSFLTGMNPESRARHSKTATAKAIVKALTS